MMNKTCTICNETKALEQFHSRSKKIINAAKKPMPETSKVSSWCRDCTSARNKERYTPRPKATPTPTPCKNCGTLKTKRKHSSRPRGYDFTCKPCSNAQKRQRYADDLEYREAKKENSRRIARENPDAYAFNRQKYRKNVKEQTPEMNVAEMVELRYFFKYNKIMPGKWHVDHDVPISKGGQHHPSNLQILSQFDNLSKGAR